MITRLKLQSQSLTFRIAVLLALALLPIGLISVSQTYMLMDEADRKQRNTLLALAAEAADSEVGYFQQALGVAQALAVAAPALRRESDACNAQLREFLNVAEPISFIGYISREGIVVCGSSGTGRDIRGGATFSKMREARAPMFMSVPNGQISKQDVVVIAAPILGDVGEFDGYVAVSLLHQRLGDENESVERDGWPVDVITFNAQGDILTADGGLENARPLLPKTVALTALTRMNRTVFEDTTRGEGRRTFAAVPLIAGQVFVLAVWPEGELHSTRKGIQFGNSLLFPLAMWAAGLGVAFYAVQTMVIRPTRNLRARMLMFMRSRQIIPREPSAIVPLEIIEMDQTWERLAQSVLRDEAELVNTIHDKTVLVKEVHHRVKNNLQLIASILNMKIRKTASPEERRALQDIQQRVMSIARVHQRLYDTASPERVQAHDLLRSIIEQSVASVLPERGDLELRQSYDKVELYPDQAVPVSLAASELILNALKYTSHTEGETPWIEVTLSQVDEKEATFTIENSIGPVKDELVPDEMAGDGLGSKLIRAFTEQIEGTVVEEQLEDRFRVCIEFPIAEFQETA